MVVSWSMVLASTSWCLCKLQTLNKWNRLFYEFAFSLSPLWNENFTVTCNFQGNVISSTILFIWTHYVLLPLFLCPFRVTLFQLPLLKGQSYLALRAKVLLMLLEAKGSRYSTFRVKERVDEYYLLNILQLWHFISQWAIISELLLNNVIPPSEIGYIDHKMSLISVQNRIIRDIIHHESPSIISLISLCLGIDNLNVFLLDFYNLLILFFNHWFLPSVL